MSFLEFVLMSLFTIIGVKYLIDMIKYALGYEINGKCRYGKKYARELAGKKEKITRKTEETFHHDSDIHDDITRLISELA